MWNWIKTLKNKSKPAQSLSQGSALQWHKESLDVQWADRQGKAIVQSWSSLLIQAHTLQSRFEICSLLLRQSCHQEGGMILLGEGCRKYSQMRVACAKRGKQKGWIGLSLSHSIGGYHSKVSHCFLGAHQVPHFTLSRFADQGGFIYSDWGEPRDYRPTTGPKGWREAADQLGILSKMLPSLTKPLTLILNLQWDELMKEEMACFLTAFKSLAPKGSRYVVIACDDKEADQDIVPSQKTSWFSQLPWFEQVFIASHPIAPQEKIELKDELFKQWLDRNELLSHWPPQIKPLKYGYFSKAKTLKQAEMDNRCVQGFWCTQDHISPLLCINDPHKLLEPGYSFGEDLLNLAHLMAQDEKHLLEEVCHGVMSQKKITELPSSAPKRRL